MNDRDVVTRKEIEEYIKNLSLNFSQMRLRWVDAHTDALSAWDKTRDVKKVLTIVINFFGFNEKYFQIAFVNTNTTKLMEVYRYPNYDGKRVDFRRKVKIIVYTKKDAVSSEYSFQKLLFAFAHELSHILLYDKHHHLRESEVATDLTALVCGFDNVWAQFKSYQSDTGYIKLEDKQFVLDCINKHANKIYL